MVSISKFHKDWLNTTMRTAKKHLENDDATARLATMMAKADLKARIYHLVGDLGAGKTAFTRAFIHALGHDGHVKSPTYTIAETYQVRGGKCAHLDLYRFESPEEWYHAGLDDVVEDAGIVFIEWPSMGEGYVPDPDVVVHLSVDGQGRSVEFEVEDEKLFQSIKEVLDGF